MKEDLRIVYMGTPDFATEPLRRLADGGYNIAGVITMPDKPAGRGHKIQCSPVKLFALERGIPLLQPEKLKSEEFLHALRAWQADLQIVVAFRMLPEAVWNMPPLGTFNLHASLLPQYRGAAPINRAIIDGQTETGVTTFFLTHEIDTGGIIAQKKVKLEDTDDAGTLHDKLMDEGATLVVETVERIIAGTAGSTPQESISHAGEWRTAPKIFKEDCRVNWKLPVKQTYDLIRGLSPYPAAWAELQLPDGETVAVKIYETAKDYTPHTLRPGSIRTDGKTYLKAAVADGLIDIKSMQFPGKKRLPADELLRGCRIDENARFLP